MSEDMEDKLDLIQSAFHGLGEALKDQCHHCRYEELNNLPKCHICKLTFEIKWIACTLDHGVVENRFENAIKLIDYLTARDPNRGKYWDYVLDYKLSMESAVAEAAEAEEAEEAEEVGDNLPVYSAPS
ncbi:hypothetical protein HK104_004630 [Borealophlyctis nickersoniae]|nr:hypothetical protein HK104_004630 [Borealophlyctis nickersoniae]